MKRAAGHASLIAIAMVATAGAAGTAFAQDSSDTATPSAQAAEAEAAADEEQADQGIADIVVTARKREENLQEIPDSITAFSADAIADRRLERIDDFLAQTPNVRINNDQDTATNNIAIRGLGSNRNQAAAVAFSVDGVVLPDSDAFTMDLSDVERLEVLKGPQGALYGKGAIAGAINITTKRPTNELEGEIKAGYSSGDNVRVFGAISGPLIEDKLLARVTASHRDGDGTIINALDGRGLDRNRQTRLTGRLIFEPTPDLSFDLRGAYTRERGGSTWFSLFNVLGTTGGEITSDIADTPPSQDGPSLTRRKITDFSLAINYDSPIGTFTSISAYDRIDVFFNQDLDVSPFPLVPQAYQTRLTRSFSQELRLTSPGSQRLRYIVGGYYQNSKRDIDTAADLDLCLFLGNCFSGPGGSFASSGVISAALADNRITFDQYAVFGQLNYDIMDTLELTAALRYDSIKGRLNDYQSAITEEETFSKLQPKLSLAYKPSDALTLYATYSQGFKSGNFNPASAGPAFPRVVGAETSRNYELGAKTSWFDRKLILNVAAFYTEHLNPQIFQLDAATFTQGSLNARKAEIKGIELELNARPARGFDINAGFGYIDTRIADFDGVTDTYVGQQLPNAPEFTFNLGAQYRHPISNGVDGRIRIDYAAVGRQSFQDFQNPAAPDLFLFQKAYNVVDAQLGLEGRNWSATFFVRNLFGRDYATSAFSRYIFAAGFLQLNADAVQIDPGRIFGGELSFRF
ncbi:TonB-dependent receptor [Sphingosinicella rhizophila]|uniref:TonB-dependent receptor n=1 Tax=Sphingosinicella rhizophila TaxID=3050082 RepID=A0ABU3Q848_9SPHN|nr:TonB-dependent receptor [Sphingosinicella sp. GR2756]MDT9599143.1 TonB-dependent receptor [Sphingosinicella sp. GR2756]